MAKISLDVLCSLIVCSTHTFRLLAFLHYSSIECSNACKAPFQSQFTPSFKYSKHSEQTTGLHQSCYGAAYAGLRCGVLDRDDDESIVDKSCVQDVFCKEGDLQGSFAGWLGRRKDSDFVRFSER